MLDEQLPYQVAWPPVITQTIPPRRKPNIRRDFSYLRLDALTRETSPVKNCTLNPDNFHAAIAGDAVTLGRRWTYRFPTPYNYGNQAFEGKLTGCRWS
jgi:hypothetical protein